ncbi:MAG: PQQ-binding-like beta-propeller repeat protein, partial [Maricaulaceae bacterium]
MRKHKANLFVQSALAAFACVGASAQEGAPNGEWLTWGGDAGHTRYSALDQITLDNVDQLEIAWRWAVPPPGDRPASNFKSTPLMHDGVLYVPSGAFGASAIDAGTGETIWNYAPPEKEGGGGRGASLSSRALTMWIDGESVRLIHSTEDGRLISIDAATGEADPDFGEGGIVDLSLPASDGGEPLGVRVVSPAVVVGDVIVSSVIPGQVRDRDVAAPGFIRGFDVHTGEQLWTFHTIPQEGEFGVDTWENESWRISSAAGAWTMMTADPETGYVYIGTETANDDGSAGAEFYAGNRPGDNLFAESIVCLDSATGERVWHFQIVHHGIWDYDMPAAPI